MFVLEVNVRSYYGLKRVTVGVNIAAAATAAVDTALCDPAQDKAAAAAQLSGT